MTISKNSFLKDYQKLLKKHGTQRAVARATGIPRTTIQSWLAEPFTFIDRKPAKSRLELAPSEGVRSFIFAYAQNETRVHEGFLTNLEAYAERLGAKISISGGTYNKRLFHDHRKDANDHGTQYHERVRPYIEHRQVRIGENLVWCAEMNTLPTAVSPLSGFEIYTQHRSGIFPHAKVQLQSIPVMKGQPPKILMTTGAVTLPNYVQKRAGIKAQFHHIIGAVLVQIDDQGRHFCRHLLAEKDGSFQDLTTRVSKGKVTEGHRVEAINWGDVHLENVDGQVAYDAWGIEIENGIVRLDEHARARSMVKTLNPRVQFFHDTGDFDRRNHHNVKDPHFRFEMFARGTERVGEAFDMISEFVLLTRQDDCLSVVVESNHDRAVKRWLAEADWRTDPVNAIFFLEAQLTLLKGIEVGEEPSILEWAVMRRRPKDFDGVVFLREDESFTICDDGIECGMHGHLGANGARGAPRQFTRMGARANTGHTHSAGIIDGIYTAGTSSLLNLGYNKGLSSWSHSHIVTLPNGKRQIITMIDGKWRA